MTSTEAAAAPVLRRDWRKRREIVTPEGVPLTVELAEFSERAVALVVDLLICIGLTVAIVLLFVYLAAHGLSGIILFAVLNLVAFFLRVLYFIQAGGAALASGPQALLDEAQVPDLGCRDAAQDRRGRRDPGGVGLLEEGADDLAGGGIEGARDQAEQARAVPLP